MTIDLANSLLTQFGKLRRVAFSSTSFLLFLPFTLLLFPVDLPRPLGHLAPDLRLGILFAAIWRIPSPAVWRSLNFYWMLQIEKKLLNPFGDPEKNFEQSTNFESHAFTSDIRPITCVAVIFCLIDRFAGWLDLPHPQPPVVTNAACLEVQADLLAELLSAKNGSLAQRLAHLPHSGTQPVTVIHCRHRRVRWQQLDSHR